MSVQSIRQGEMSARTSDGGAYSARLAAFQENYTRPQFTDTVKEFTDIINADQIKAEKFTESALGTKVVPSTTNMYESHFLLAKEKFDQLYSDETLDYFSKDEGGMQKWAGMVDKLNQEIKTYEQIYQDSFGTASATGEGGTWSDHKVRMDQFGGDEQAWFKSRGLNLINTDSFNETMKNIDGRGHANLTLDLESGTFNYDLAGGVDKDWLEPTDPNTAARLFSYQTEQATFNTENEYVNEIYDTFLNDGEEATLVSLKNLKGNYNFQLAAISHHLRNLPEDHEDKGMKVMDWYKKSQDKGLGLGISGVEDTFINSIRDGAQNRKKREEAKKKRDEAPEGPTYNESTLSSNAFTDEIELGLPTQKADGEATVPSEASDFTVVTLGKTVSLSSEIGQASQVIYFEPTQTFYAMGTYTGRTYVPLTDNDILLLNNKFTGTGRNDFNQRQSVSEFVGMSGGEAAQFNVQ